jgi:hypothetical protein
MAQTWAEVKYRPLQLQPAFWASHMRFQP